MIVGLVGKSCSGKDTVASLLDDRFSVIDEDKLGHEALEKNIDRILATFGPDVIKDGVVDRKALGRIVFSDSSKLEALNNITHPWMKEETLTLAREIEKSGKIAVINAALLEEMGFVEYCDEILFVISPYEKREERAVLRDGITPEGYKKRALSQKNIGESLYSSGKKVITIINDETKEKLSRQVGFYCASINKTREK